MRRWKKVKHKISDVNPSNPDMNFLLEISTILSSSLFRFRRSKTVSDYDFCGTQIFIPGKAGFCYYFYHVDHLQNQLETQNI